MSDELYAKIADEMDALESQYSPWDDEPHRAAFAEAFTAFLTGLGLTWDDWQNEISRRMDLNDKRLAE